MEKKKRKYCDYEITTFQYYRSNAKKFFKETISIDLKQIYKPFLKLIPDKGRILDAGCGSGRDTKFFMEKGFKVTSFDNSPEMVKLASDFTGQPCLLLSFDEINYKNRFDGIWACSSILHVPKNKLPDIMQKLTNALKPSGIMYASFKYGNEEYIEQGRYFSNYNENTFSILLNEIKGIKPVKYWRTKDKRYENKKWLNVLIKKG